MKETMKASESREEISRILKSKDDKRSGREDSSVATWSARLGKLGIRVVRGSGKELLKSISGKEVYLITGMPGSGKSWLAGNASNPQKWQSLDELGADKHGKWIIDLAKITGGKSVFYGTGDNLREVIRKIASFGKKMGFVYLVPDFESWREAVTLKAQADTPFKKHFQAMAKWSKSKFLREVDTEFRLCVAALHWGFKMGVPASGDAMEAYRDFYRGDADSDVVLTEIVAKLREAGHDVFLAFNGPFSPGKGWHESSE
jgi:hypothetical protein